MLLLMVETIKEREYNVRSVAVVRNGAIVLDACFPPFREDTWHTIHSCSKSVTSALIGIAIAKGYIQSVDQRVLDFFPEVRVPVSEDRKEEITLRHLLTMSSGLDTRDSYLYRWQGLQQMRGNQDWTRHVLSLPMVASPGERFEYSNCTSYLLSVILQKATGMTALAFAKANMFEHMDITEIDWESSPQGVSLGWGGIRMKPLDLAKIGMLYLNNGLWNDRQLIPTGWVHQSTRRHIDAGTLSDGYGYQWWVDSAGYYMMLGYGGQYVIVHPARKMVVVFTSALESRDFFVPEILLQNFIIPATLSSEPLPTNAQAAARLDSLVDAIRHPEPGPLRPLPQTAMEVSGKTYLLSDNRIGYKSMSLTFEPDRQEARLDLSLGQKNIRVRIGLDGLYRLSESEGHLRAYRGSWEDERTFLLDYQVVDHTERGSARMKFEGNTVTIWIEEVIQGLALELVGRLKD